MRPLLIGVILAIPAVPAAASDAQHYPAIQIQWGGSASRDAPSIGIGPTPIPQTKPPGAAALQRDRDDRSSWGPREKPDRDRRGDKPRKPRFPDRDFPRKPGLPRQRPFLFLDDDDDDRIIVVPSEPEAPVEPEAKPPPEPPARPDPRGPKFVPARGAAGEAPYTVGEPLPEGVPFVALDWDQYGLPEPPRGLVYARVAGDVLLIDPASRMVERRVDVAELGSTGDTVRAGAGPQ